MGRGNQYIELVKVLCCKLPTIGEILPFFPNRVRVETAELRGGWQVGYHCTIVTPVVHVDRMQQIVKSFKTGPKLQISFRVMSN